MYKNRLETFICVADVGSFSKAAEVLYISATAVIKQINLLESDLQLRLFVRTHRGLSLTPAGQSLYQDAKYIIQYTNAALVRAKNAMQVSSNTLRIGTSIMTPSDFLIELWPRIQQHCPQTKFQLVHFENTPQNAREILSNLGRDIDIVPGFFDQTLLNSRACTALELSQDPLCCAVPINHKLAGKEYLEITDLFGETLMLRHNWINQVDELRMDILQHYPQIKIEAFDFYSLAVFNQCENSNNIIVSTEKWANVHPLLKIIPVKWTYKLSFGILYSPQPSLQVRDFIAAVQKVFGLKKQ